MCNYVRRIGLFPITGYCSNTTSCTQNHCELKSNKVCHCYRGKLFFYFFLSPPQVCMLTFPGTLPVWMKCTVMYLCLTGNMWKIQDKCGSNSRTKIVFFDLCYMEPYGLVSEQSSAVSRPGRCIKKWNQRCPHKGKQLIRNKWPSLQWCTIDGSLNPLRHRDDWYHNSNSSFSQALWQNSFCKNGLPGIRGSFQSVRNVAHNWFIL